MRASRPSCRLSLPTQADLDTLMQPDISVMALATPKPMQIARGRKAHDGLFEPDPSGDRWYAFEVADTDDLMFWHSKNGEIATWSGRAFALGEEIIEEASTYALDHALNIFANALDWLRADRDGIMVLPDQWPLAFDRLRDAPRIAIAEDLLPLYRRHMKPARMPRLLVIPSRRRAA